MFTVIDLLFTGTNPNRDRIVSVAMANYDGSQLTDNWASLLNPELSLSPLEAAFLHIDPADLPNAPSFADIAQQILAFTEGRILVGLQVRLLYAMLLGEFRRTAHKFQRRQICLTKLITQHFGVRQARSVTAVCEHFKIPFSTSYSLAERLPILAAIFEQLFLQNLHVTDKKHIRQAAVDSKFPPQLPLDKVERLPNSVGVYYFTGKRGEILYLGKSTNIKKRVLSHFSSDVRTKGKPALTTQIYDIQYRLTGSELIALLLESDEIKRFMPAFNRAQRRLRYTYAVYIYKNIDNYYCLIPTLLQPEDTMHEKGYALLQKFTSQWAAVSWVFYAARQYALQLDLCGVQNFVVWLEQAGFAEEDFATKPDSPEAYNERVQQLIAQQRYPHNDMLIIDKGRSSDEKSVVIIKNNKYKGYAYLPEQDADNWETAQEMLIPFRENPDVQRIIRTYICKHAQSLKILYKT